MSGYLARLAARAVGMSPPGAPPATAQSVPAFPPSLDHLDTVSDTGLPTGVPIEPPPVETVPPVAPPERWRPSSLPPGAPPGTPDAAARVPPMPVAVGPSNEADSTAVTIDLELGDVPVGGASPLAAARPAVQPAVEAAPPVDDEVAMPVSLSPAEGYSTLGDVVDPISTTTSAASPTPGPVAAVPQPGIPSPPAVDTVTATEPAPRLETREIVAAAPAPSEPRFPSRPDLLVPLLSPPAEPAPIDVHIGTIEISAEPPPPQGATRTVPPRPGLDEYASLRTYQWDDRSE